MTSLAGKKKGGTVELTIPREVLLTVLKLNRKDGLLGYNYANQLSGHGCSGENIKLCV